MILYYAPGASPGSRWQPTQDKAKVLHQPFDQFRVGEQGRQEMCDLLNKGELYTFGLGVGMKDEIGELEPSNSEDTVPVVREAAKRVSIYEIEDYILNHATIAGVEDIFAAIGTRFKALVDDRRGA
jgi:hypothetical protein